MKQSATNADIIYNLKASSFSYAPGYIMKNNHALNYSLQFYQTSSNIQVCNKKQRLQKFRIVHTGSRLTCTHNFPRHFDVNRST